MRKTERRVAVSAVNGVDQSARHTDFRDVNLASVLYGVGRIETDLASDKCYSFIGSDRGIGGLARVAVHSRRHVYRDYA